MKAIAVTEFKAHCLSLLEDVARSGQPLVITKWGKPLARVVPTSGGNTKYPQQTLQGTVRVLGDLIRPVIAPDEWNAVRGVLLSQEETGRSRRRRRSRR